MIIALVLGSAFLHAAWNALLKAEPDKDRAVMAAVGFGAGLATIVALVRAQLTGVEQFPTLASLAGALIAGALEQLYFMALARALDRGPLAPIYTISRGGAVIVIFPLSIALFGEPLTATGVAGAALVLVGLIATGLPSGGAANARPLARAAIGWALACAVAIAAYHLAYKAALSAGGAPSAVFAASLVFATAINAVRAGASGRRAIAALARTRGVRVGLMGALCSASFLILIEALARGGAGFVLTLRNTSVLFALGLAWMIGERPRVTAAVGAVLVAAGAIVMTQ